MLAIKKFIAQYDFLLIAAIASIAATLITLAHQQPFNVDGIRYLDAASAYLHQGSQAAISSYGWPFYSISIAIVSKFSSLPLASAAFLLNTVLNTITLISFILLIKELGGDRKIQFFALLLIIVYPYLNHDRNNILRDFGYYAFGLLSLLFYIRYLKELNWRNAIGWGVSIILATLFRIEGCVFLILIPFITLFLPRVKFTTRLKYFFQINAVNLIWLFLLAVWMLLHSHHPASSNTGRLTEPYMYLRHGYDMMMTGFNNRATAMQPAFISNGQFNSIPAFIMGGLAGTFISTFFNTTGLLYILLAGYAFRYRLIQVRFETFAPWVGYIFINLIIIFSFLVLDFFLTTRYIAFLSLLIMLAAPFSLATIYDGWRLKQNRFTGKKWIFPLIVVFLFINAADSFWHFGHSKTYVIKAGNWIANNTNTNSVVCSNDAQLSYYSHRNSLFLANVSQDTFVNLTKTNLVNCNILAILVSHDETKLSEQIIAFVGHPPLQIFQNKQADKVVIFKYSH